MIIDIFPEPDLITCKPRKEFIEFSDGNYARDA